MCDAAGWAWELPVGIPGNVLSHLRLSLLVVAVWAPWSAPCWLPESLSIYGPVVVGPPMCAAVPRLVGPLFSMTCSRAMGLITWVWSAAVVTWVDQ